MNTPDEEVFASYVIGRKGLTYTQAKTLRERISSRYGFNDKQYRILVSEFLRRSGNCYKTTPDPDAHLLDPEQMRLLRTLIRLVSPNHDLGEPTCSPRPVTSTKPSKPVSPPLPSHCPVCRSSTGHQKVAYRSFELAASRAQEVWKNYLAIQEPYECPEAYGFHLRTIKDPYRTSTPKQVPQPSPPSPAVVPLRGTPKPKPPVPEPTPFVPAPFLGELPGDTRSTRISDLVLSEQSSKPTELTARIREFLKEHTQSKEIKSIYNWLHVEAIDVLVDLERRIIYTSQEYRDESGRLLLQREGVEIAIEPKDVLWR